MKETVRKKPHLLTIWITGLPGSGKSAYSDKLKKAFPEFIVLRMDEIRKIVTPKPSFSEEERDLLYRALVFTAKWLSDAGHGVIIDATGNRRRWRGLARGLIPGYMEIYLKCPLDVCIKREKKRRKTRSAPKNIYSKAAKGWPVPGLTVPYEEPLSPEVVIDTSVVSISGGIATIKKWIKDNRGVL